MNVLIKKINNAILHKEQKVFFSLFFILTLSLFVSLYFLFSSVSYTYAIKKQENRLNSLLLENTENIVFLFNKEKKIYTKSFGNDLIVSSETTYVRPTTLVKNY